MGTGQKCIPINAQIRSPGTVIIFSTESSHLWANVHFANNTEAVCYYYLLAVWHKHLETPDQSQLSRVLYNHNLRDQRTNSLKNRYTEKKKIWCWRDHGGNKPSLSRWSNRWGIKPWKELSNPNPNLYQIHQLTLPWVTSLLSFMASFCDICICVYERKKISHLEKSPIGATQ